jgi:hypothetical protein
MNRPLGGRADRYRGPDQENGRGDQGSRDGPEDRSLGFHRASWLPARCGLGSPSPGAELVPLGSQPEAESPVISRSSVQASISFRLASAVSSRQRA